MDKHTEQYFKSILAEEPADYSRPTRFAGSYLGKLRYYLNQFRRIDYREAFSSFASGTKNLGGNIMKVLNRKIEKPKPVEVAATEKPKEQLKDQPEEQPKEQPKVDVELKSEAAKLPDLEKPAE